MLMDSCFQPEVLGRIGFNFCQKGRYGVRCHVEPSQHSYAFADFYRANSGLAFVGSKLEAWIYAGGWTLWSNGRHRLL